MQFYDSNFNPRVHINLLSLYHNCDSTTIQLRYDDTTTHSTTTNDRNYDLRSIRLRHDYDTTTTKNLTCSVFAGVEWRRMEAGARDTSYSYRNRIVVERNCNHGFSDIDGSSS